MFFLTHSVVTLPKTRILRLDYTLKCRIPRSNGLIQSLRVPPEYDDLGVRGADNMAEGAWTSLGLATAAGESASAEIRELLLAEAVAEEVGDAAAAASCLSAASLRTRDLTRPRRTAADVDLLRRPRSQCSSAAW